MSNLQEQAQSFAILYPALFAQAKSLALNLQSGSHLKKRAGAGDQFWQYRPIQPHDDARRIDWRRSARTDSAFIKEREWQNTQPYLLWVNTSASMQFSSDRSLPSKYERAALLALTLALILHRQGERVQLINEGENLSQISNIANVLSAPNQPQSGYGHIPSLPNTSQKTLFIFSDFLTPIEEIKTQIAPFTVNLNTKTTPQVTLFQVLDPQELAPFTQDHQILHSFEHQYTYNVNDAQEAAKLYSEKFEQHQESLQTLCTFHSLNLITHTTSHAPDTAFLKLQHQNAKARQTPFAPLRA